MGFLGGAGMAGAAGGANQALQNYLQFYMQNKQLGLEREKYGEQKLNWAEQRRNWAAERAEREFKTEQEKAMRTDLSGLYAPRPEIGMMSTGGPFVPQGDFAVDPSLDLPMATGKMIPGQPSTEQLMGVLGKYDPKAAVTAQVSMRNLDERLTHAMDLQNVKSTAEAQRLYDKLDSQEKMWREREDARSQAIADKFDAKMAELEKLYDLKKELQAEKVKSTATSDRIERKTAADAEAKLLDPATPAETKEAYASLINDSGLPYTYVPEPVKGGWLSKDTVKWVKVMRKGGATSKKPISFFGH